MMKNGDILLLTNGRLAQVVEMNYPDNSCSMLQFIDRDECSFIDIDELDIESNLGQSPVVLSNFWTARSIHLRLNRISKV